MDDVPISVLEQSVVLFFPGGIIPDGGNLRF